MKLINVHFATPHHLELFRWSEREVIIFQSKMFDNPTVLYEEIIRFINSRINRVAFELLTDVPDDIQYLMRDIARMNYKFDITNKQNTICAISDSIRYDCEAIAELYSEVRDQKFIPSRLTIQEIKNRIIKLNVLVNIVMSKNGIYRNGDEKDIARQHVAYNRTKKLLLSIPYCDLEDLEFACSNYNVDLEEFDLQKIDLESNCGFVYSTVNLLDEYVKSSNDPNIRRELSRSLEIIRLSFNN